MSVFLSQRPSLRNAITAQLAQTMALVELPLDDLEAKVAQELAANPALEAGEEGRCPQCGRRLRRLPCPVCAHPPASADDPVVYLSTRHLRERIRSSREADDERLEAADRCSPDTLPDHIMRQIAPALDAADRPIAVYLLANLDERGFLVEAPAMSAGALQVSLDRVEAVLNVMRRADPPGIGARDIRESLLLQIESLEEEGCGHALARAILAEHWDALLRHDLPSIARGLNVSREDVEAALAFIRRNLTPYPAHVGWSEDGNRASVEAVVCCQPDAAITRFEDERGERLQIEVFTPVANWLCVAPVFKAALADCSEGDRSRWEQHVERAQRFVTGLQYRNNTMCHLLTVIAREQRRFILGGDLRPMTRAVLAAQLGLHESTISRAVAHKHVALPNRQIVPLAIFFDRSLPIRKAMKLIITNESRPLADDEIAVQLAEQGHPVARRTIAKYRVAEGILPATARAIVAG